jgi:hypothetical protein
VQYFDERGRARSTVVFAVGDVVYVPENAETWARNLRPATKWLQEAVKAKMPVRSSAPSADNVDIIPNAASVPAG